ncbi:MAG: multidrug effflux MFS transporter [Proteobacteria bacterium]|nr:multidrug effflux MFS transporter [Pseudomonadota bacterium]
MSNHPILIVSQKNPQAQSLFSMVLLMIPLVLPLGLALDLYLPSIPFMSTALNSSPIQIQLSLSVFMYCFGFGQLFVGPITDKFGRRKILLLSLVFFTFGSILCAVSKTLNLLLAGRALQAFGACGTQVVAFAMVRDQYEAKDATFIFTTLKGAMAIAPISAPILGALLQTYFGWQANFMMLFLYGLTILWLSYKKLPETQFQTPATFRFKENYLAPYKLVLSNKHFLYFSLCGLVSQAAMFGYFSLSSQYFVGLHGLSELEFALLFSANAFVFLFTAALISKRIYQLGYEKCTLIGSMMLLISAILMILGHLNFEHFCVLFLPNLIASSAVAIMLGAGASGALMPFKNNAGCATALFGCIEFIGGAFVGSFAIWGNRISVLPLAICLFSLGILVVVGFFAIMKFKFGKVMI